MEQWPLKNIWYKSKPGNKKAVLASLAFFFLFLFFLVYFPSGLSAAQVSLAWDLNTEPDLAGYKIYIGYASRTYSWIVDAGNKAQAVVDNLQDGTTYYFSLTAYNTQALESGFSNEVTYTVPGASQAALSVTRSGTGAGTVTATGISCGSDCSESYPVNTQVTLTAAADAGSTFGGWGGACSGTAGTCMVTMSASQSVTANFSLKTYAITSSTGGNGSISPSGSVFVNHGASQTYTITPNAGYKISDVLVDGVSVGAVGSYTFAAVTAGHIILASFVVNTTPSYVLTVAKNGTGSGTVTNSPAGTSFTAGTTVTLTATADTGSTFGGWGGACSGTAGTCTVTMSANRSVTATFTRKTYAITSSTGSNGSISPSGSVFVNHGASQTYTITPNKGYKISDVLVDGVSVGAVGSYTFSAVTAGHVILASFTANSPLYSTTSYNLTVTKRGTGSGLVTNSPAGSTFSSGTKVNLVAAPDASSTFEGWGGACSGTATTCTVTMSANRTVRATFTLKTFTINASAAANGSVKPAGTTRVVYGGSQNYTINPASGYQVATVTVDGASVGPVSSYTFGNMRSNHTISATFSEIPKNSPRSLQIGKKGSGRGTVSTNPAGSVFDSGAQVELTAAPDTGSTFAGWSGDCTGTDPICVVIMNADQSVSATFETANISYKVFLPLLNR